MICKRQLIQPVPVTLCKALPINEASNAANDDDSVLFHVSLFSEQGWPIAHFYCDGIKKKIYLEWRKIITKALEINAASITVTRKLTQEPGPIGFDDYYYCKSLTQVLDGLKIGLSDYCVSVRSTQTRLSFKRLNAINIIGDGYREFSKQVNGVLS